MPYQPEDYAKRYRRHAEELRALAANSGVETVRTTYLELAAKFESMAARAEADAKAAAEETPHRRQKKNPGRKPGLS